MSATVKTISQDSSTNDAGKIKYMVACQERTLSGIDGKINDDASNCDPDDLGTYDSLEAALGYIRGLNPSDYHQVEVHDTPYGIGSVTRNVFTVDRIALDEDGDWQLCDEGGNTDLASCPEPAKVVDVLDWYPTVRETFERCIRGYCKWLDYDGEDYSTINSAMQVHAEEVGTVGDATCYRCHSGMLGTFSAVRYGDTSGTSGVSIAEGMGDVLAYELTEEQLEDELASNLWWGDNDATSLEDWLVLELVADAI